MGTAEAHVNDEGQSRTKGILPWSENLVGDPNTRNLHGGVITSLLDHYCGHAAGLCSQGMVATLDLRIDYMRPALPECDIIGEGQSLRTTRSAVFTQGLAYQKNPSEPIATARGVFFRTGQPQEPDPSGKTPLSRSPSDHEEVFRDLPSRPPSAPDYQDEGEANETLDSIPFARLLGIRALAIGGQLTTVLPYNPWVIGNPLLPAVHGGAVGSLLETASLLHLKHIANISGNIRPVSITMDYLRSGKPQDIFAQVHIQRLGRRVCNLRAEAWQEDVNRPIAAFRANLLLPTARPKR